MVVWPKHVVAITSEEEKRNCRVDGPLINIKHVTRVALGYIEAGHPWSNIRILMCVDKTVTPIAQMTRPGTSVKNFTASIRFICIKSGYRIRQFSMTPCQAGWGREGSDHTILHKVITGRAGLLPTITLQASKQASFLRLLSYSTASQSRAANAKGSKHSFWLAPLRGVQPNCDQIMEVFIRLRNVTIVG
jgi:hypothetical protein